MDDEGYGERERERGGGAVERVQALKVLTRF